MNIYTSRICHMEGRKMCMRTIHVVSFPGLSPKAFIGIGEDGHEANGYQLTLLMLIWCINVQMGTQRGVLKGWGVGDISI